MVSNRNKYGISASFDLGIAKEVGIEAAVIYNELRFWADKGSKKDGWIYKSYAEMLDKFPLSEYQLRKAYKLLISAGIIETKIVKIEKAPTLHFRFLKNFSHNQFMTEKTSETMVSLKTSETSIYTEDNHNTTDFASVQETGEAGSNPTPPTPSPRPEILLVFQEVAKKLHPKQSILYSSGRQAKIKQRLRSFKPEQIIMAADNLTHSPWHRGENPGKIKYASFDFLMRSDEKVEEWMNKIPVQIKKSAF